MMRAAACVAAILVAAVDLAAQAGTPPRAPRNVVREVRVSGGLLLREQAAEFTRSLETPAELVIVDVRCDAWRESVVESMAREITRYEGKVAVVLRADDTGVVPAGALALGLCADRLWIDASAKVRLGLHATRFDEEPEGERATAALVDIVQEASEGVIGDRSIVESLFRPRTAPVRVARVDGRLVIPTDEQTGQTWTLTEPRADGAHTLAFSAGELIEMGLASPVERTNAYIPRELGMGPMANKRVAIDMSLDRERVWALRAVEDAKAELAAIDRALDEAESRYRTSPSLSRLRDAGAAATARLYTMTRLLDGIDERLGVYPEVLCTPAPSQSELTGGDRDDRIRGWTKALSSLRKQTDGLRTRAGEIAAR